MEIKAIDSKAAVSGRFLIVENQLRTAKNGRNYLALKLADASGEIIARVWEADQELYQRLAVGQVLELDQVWPKLYHDQVQLDWDAKAGNTFRVVPENEVDYQQFLTQAPSDLAAAWEYLLSTLATITDPYLQQILRYFFDNPDFKAEFIRVPAAMKRHHAYIGGLLEHTAGVTALCQAAAEYYPLVQRELLLSGALLHDIGKTRSYKLERGIEGSDEGKLLGHLVLGVELVEAAITQVAIKAADPEKVGAIRNSLVHLLVSHHGIMEWGSPVEPLTVEACILHHADNMDAQIAKFLALIRGERSGTEWSAFDSRLGRSIYLGDLVRGPSPEGPEEV